MRLFRSALLEHPLLALAIGLAGLMLRLAVPAGFMPAVHHGQLSLTPCSGYGVAESKAAHVQTLPAPAMDHHDEGRPNADGSCAFADLSLPMIGGADPIQLASALLFIIAAALFVAALLPPGAGLRLRPPLRGPPLPT